MQVARCGVQRTGSILLQKPKALRTSPRKGASHSSTLKIGFNSPCDELMARRSSDVAWSCSRASFSSRISREFSPGWPASSGMRLADSFCALRRFSFAALRPCAFAGLPLTLECLFIGFPLGWGRHPSRSNQHAGSGAILTPGRESPLALPFFRDKTLSPRRERYRVAPRRYYWWWDLSVSDVWFGKLQLGVLTNDGKVIFALHLSAGHMQTCFRATLCR
jgi:hypothetical protein